MTRRDAPLRATPAPALLSRRAFLAGTTGGAALALAGCSMGTKQMFTGGSSGTTIAVAIVSNSQMQDAISLSHLFESEHPNINLDFISLPENEARAKITTDVSTGGGEFDVVMISNYETPMWSANGWLVNLQPYIDATPGYDANDFLPQLRATLSHQGDLYSVPFYGESSFLMYRKDLMAQAGITMPLKPTWDQVGKIAAQMHNEKKGLVGICLRGVPGWGENLAPINTVINSFGGRWYDPAWQAQLTSPEVQRAVSMYVSLVRTYGEPGAPSAGFSECATLYGQGDAAMWYDATSAVGAIEDPQSSKVASYHMAASPWPERAAVGLALHLVAGDPHHLPQQAGGLGLHRLDDLQVLHQDGGPDAGLVTRASRQPLLQLPDTAVQEAVGRLRPADAAVDQRDQHRAPDHQAGALHRGPVPRHPRVPGPRHQRQPADERRHRRAEAGGGGAVAVAALRPGRRRQLQVGVMDGAGAGVEPERR